MAFPGLERLRQIPLYYVACSTAQVLHKTISIWTNVQLLANSVLLSIKNFAPSVYNTELDIETTRSWKYPLSHIVVNNIEFLEDIFCSFVLPGNTSCYPRATLNKAYANAQKAIFERENFSLYLRHYRLKLLPLKGNKSISSLFKFALKQNNPRAINDILNERLSKLNFTQIQTFLNSFSVGQQTRARQILRNYIRHRKTTEEHRFDVNSSAQFAAISKAIVNHLSPPNITQQYDFSALPPKGRHSLTEVLKLLIAHNHPSTFMEVFSLKATQEHLTNSPLEGLVLFASALNFKNDAIVTVIESHPSIKAMIHQALQNFSTYPKNTTLPHDQESLIHRRLLKYPEFTNLAKEDQSSFIELLSIAMPLKNRAIFDLLFNKRAYLEKEPLLCLLKMASSSKFKNLIDWILDIPLFNELIKQDRPALLKIINLAFKSQIDPILEKIITSPDSMKLLERDPSYYLKMLVHLIKSENQELLGLALEYPMFFDFLKNNPEHLVSLLKLIFSRNKTALLAPLMQHRLIDALPLTGKDSYLVFFKWAIKKKDPTAITFFIDDKRVRDLSLQNMRLLHDYAQKSHSLFAAESITAFIEEHFSLMERLWV
jgi:hypothetical protein